MFAGNNGCLQIHGFPVTIPLELNAKPRRHHHHRNTGMRQDASHPNTHLAGSIAPTPLPAHATCRLRRDDIFPCQPGAQWTCQKLEYLKMEDPPNCFPHRQVAVFDNWGGSPSLRNTHITSTCYYWFVFCVRNVLWFFRTHLSSQRKLSWRELIRWMGLLQALPISPGS